MKKITTIILALVMCIALVACGAPDKQPAIDAFNEAKDAFNEIAVAINADIDSYADEVVDTMIEMAGVLEQHKQLLEGTEEISQEKLDEMIKWFGEVKAWAAQVKAEISEIDER